MKRLFTVLFILFSTLSFSGEKDSSAKNLLRIIGFEKFCDNVAKVRKYKSTEEIKSLDYKLRYFFKYIKPWSFFDERKFSLELKTKLISSFTKSELQILAEKLNTPFRVKVLNASILYRDLFSFYENLYDESFKISNLVSSRNILLRNVYIMHGMDIQKSYLQAKLKRYEQSNKRQTSVIKNGKPSSYFIETKMLKSYLEKTDLILLSELAKELKDFRHYELREYLRLLKGDSLTQRFIQLFANFHFLYISKYIHKVSTDKALLLSL